MLVQKEATMASISRATKAPIRAKLDGFSGHKNGPSRPWWLVAADRAHDPFECSSDCPPRRYWLALRAHARAPKRVSAAPSGPDWLLRDPRGR